MTGLWKTWMTVWCWGAIGFGAMLTLAAFPATQGPTHLYYSLLSDQRVTAETLSLPEMRLTLAVLGAVMIGWGFTIIGMVQAANAGGGAPVWRALTGAILIWFAVDSAVSIYTGFALNAASNTVFLLTYLAPVLASGVLKGLKTSP